MKRLISLEKRERDWLSYGLFGPGSVHAVRSVQAAGYKFTAPPFYSAIRTNET